MSQVTSRASWLSVLLVALLAVSTVSAHPIHQTDEKMEKGQAGNLELRSPRLIPDTQKYLHDLLQGLGLQGPTATPTLTPTATPTRSATTTATATPTATPTARVETEQDLENMPTQTTHIVYSSSTSYTPTASVETKQDLENIPTQTTHIVYSSSTSYTPTDSSNPAEYTHTVKNIHNHTRPVENIQVGHGWKWGNKITADDLPAIFDAVYKELAHRLSDRINSSDEVGVENFL
ncbi:hypothetical protein N7471_002499 [Penicillium samsonianum]|uniref:uncharacterized protein n=1 Tax=Penicillium samsonianum TaxID=1882272 RepID=UPI0025481F8F|nr:uncharacterized protein N7471_002499 [Penicillium samsonianum]KAJ6143046.1 hypothetical protein N7471_002499 [Penicillium samsonianum]